MSTFGLLIMVGGLICAIIVLFTMLYQRSENGDEDKASLLKPFKWASGILVVSGILGFILMSIAVVPVGNVGVVLRFGAATGTYLEPGLRGKAIVDKVVLMNTRTQKFETDATAASKDLQDVTAKIAINYKIHSETAVRIYSTLGEGYIETIAHPAIQETVKEITARYNAEDMILKRAEIKDAIARSITDRLIQRDITVEIVNITDFKFSEVFTKSIESKVAAAQSALEAENKLQQVKVEAQQAQAKAIGAANAAIAEAEGKAKAITIVTEAQVAANKKISDSLTPEVLQYIFMDRLGSDIKVIVIPSGQNFTIGTINP